MVPFITFLSDGDERVNGRESELAWSITRDDWEWMTPADTARPAELLILGLDREYRSARFSASEGASGHEGGCGPTAAWRWAPERPSEPVSPTQRSMLARGEAAVAIPHLTWPPPAFSRVGRPRRATTPRRWRRRARVIHATAALAINAGLVHCATSRLRQPSESERTKKSANRRTSASGDECF
jgi:hypothetical protein